MISVAMATYNGGRFIRQQIDSVLNQTIQDIELVICDDCSSDDTWDILNEYAKQESRIHILRNEQNIGYKNNFENAIRLCRGDFIALADQDDIWFNRHLEILLEGIGENELIGGNVVFIDENGLPFGRTFKDALAFNRIPTQSVDISYTMLFFRNVFQGASLLMKREFAMQHLPISENVPLHDFWYGLIATLQGKAVYTNETISYYRRHGKAQMEHQEQRISWLGFMISQLKYGTTYNMDRAKIVIAEMRKRGIKVNPKGEQIIGEFESFGDCNHGIFGRLRNLYFLLTHFRLIYTC
ncbi:MAG: glycosyltransferase [Bacteroidaceae bacterium]|nr:glycosyltransferase [Bacteroidaceae bacterium]